MTDPIIYSVYPFHLSEEESQKPIHSFRVDTDGTVEGHEFETHYHLLEQVIDYGDFLGFITCDGASGFIETRIPIEALKEILKKAGKND